MIKLKDTYEKIFETVWHNYTWFLIKILHTQHCELYILD